MSAQRFALGVIGIVGPIGCSGLTSWREDGMFCGGKGSKEIYDCKYYS